MTEGKGGEGKDWSSGYFNVDYLGKRGKKWLESSPLVRLAY